jgi:hypothetical protein
MLVALLTAAFVPAAVCPGGFYQGKTLTISQTGLTGRTRARRWTFATLLPGPHYVMGIWPAVVRGGQLPLSDGPPRQFNDCNRASV